MIRAFAYHGGAVSVVQPADIPREAATRGDGGFIWVHIQSNGDAAHLLDELTLDLPPTIASALTAVETRPRCEAIDAGVLVNLRMPGDATAVQGGDPLVSLRLWAEKGLLLSVSLRPTVILPAIERQFVEAALHDPGDVIIALASAAAEATDTSVADFGDELDALECDLGPRSDLTQRRKVTRIRSHAIQYRRFVSPQRQALERLSLLPLGWLDETERALVRDAADRFARMAEELESIRERAAVLHEELTDLRAEKMDARSLQIAIVAMIFLPLTFVTGLLGMNVQGIPYAERPWAFWGVVAFCVLISFAVGGWFAIRGWSRR